MIYDGFLFFNELDLLEIRLQELDSVVDRFIVSESHYCHNGTDKPLYYADNKSRFKDFNHKIIHVVDDSIIYGLPTYNVAPFGGSNCTWVENNQRNAVGQGLCQASDKDIILLGDIDEIPKKECVKNMQLGNKNHSVCFVMDIFYYYLNNKMMNSGWSGTVASWVGTFRTMQAIRDTRMDDASPKRTRMGNAGWHFSYMGTPEMITEKLQVSADTANYKYDLEWVKRTLTNGGDVRSKMRGGGREFIPQPFSILPGYVQQNLEKFSHILKTPEKS